MSDPVKKVIEALKQILEKAKQSNALKPLENALKNVDVSTLKKQGADLAQKIQSTSGIDVKQGASDASRRMKFPYTFTAKLVHFPIKFYITHNWMWRYYFIAVIVCLPVFKYIHGLSNAPGNVQRWNELKKAEAHEHH